MSLPGLPHAPPDGPADAQASLPLASEGVSRWVWQGRFGPILIEVDGDRVLVNGMPVEPYRAAVSPGPEVGS